MTKLCARGKSAAKRKFKVYPSAYANAYASKICAGKIKDPSGVKRKDFKGPKPAKTGILIETNQDLKKERKEKEDKKYYRKRKFPKSDGKGFFDVIIKGAEILNKPPAKKIGGETKVKVNEVIKGLKKASKTHAAQAETLSTLKLKYGGGKDMGAKKKKKKARDKYDNRLEDLPRGLQIDTTTDITGSSANKMMCGGEVRGAGAAIRGTGFKGIF